jgi:mRNA interferase MazF
LKTGEIWRVNLNPVVGSELQKTRPVVIINSGHRKHLPLSIVVPVTNYKPCWNSNPFFVTLEPTPKNGLSKKSCVDCFQIRALSHIRFLQKLGNLEEHCQEEIKTALALILDIEKQHCD